MANPKFLGVDLAVPTYTWSEGTNASYPITNLKTYYPDQKSRSNALTNVQNLLIDMGSAVACNAIVIDGHNFDTVNATNGVTLQVNTNDDNTWTDAETVSFTGESPSRLDGSDNKQIHVFASLTKRYWRIAFDSTPALDAAPEIGNIFLGTRLDFEKTQEWGYLSDMPDFVNDQKRALEGRIDTTELYGISHHEIDFKFHTDAFVVLWRAFLRTVKGNARPFYYVDHNSNLWLVNFDKSFNPAKASRYNINDIARFTLVSTMGE